MSLRLNTKAAAAGEILLIIIAHGVCDTVGIVMIYFGAGI